MKAATLALLGLFLFPATADAQIEWRVSVKFILDANGNRPATGNVNTDTEVQSQIDLGNAALAASGRGYQLDLVEIIDVPGIDVWSNLDCDSLERDVFDLVARTAPAVYFWSDNAINVYISHNSCAGICSFPSDTSETIVIGQGARTTSIIHEIGHYMGLCHTQGCPCGSCGAGAGVCNDTPGSDDIGDTLPDLPCWTQNDIAQNSFSVNYASLSGGQQSQVDDVFFNILSYHSTRDRFTERQMDVMTDYSNGNRNAVATGRTYFVDTTVVPGLEIGSSLFPFGDVDDGLSAAGPGDIVLLRAGTYAEPSSSATSAVMLRSAGGSATLQ